GRGAAADRGRCHRDLRLPARARRRAAPGGAADVSRPAGAAREDRGLGPDRRQRQRGVGVWAQRLLPPGWRGPGRRAVWRRARLRRVLAATCTAAAAWLAVSAFLPDPAPVGVPVLVAVRDLPAGHRLGAADVRVDRWPPQIRPVSALREPS